MTEASIKSDTVDKVAISSPALAGSNKTESAYRTLRQAILNAQLAPGTPLRQSSLHKEFGIGWTPLREALSRLEAERLVTMQRNRGFAVAPVSHRELDDLTRARRALELAMLPESIEQGDALWEDALVAAHYRLAKSAMQLGQRSEENITHWMDRHQAFHQILLAGSSSPWLTHLYMQIMDQVRRHQRVLMVEPLMQDAQQSQETDRATPFMTAMLDSMDIRHHTDLMEAALDRDVARATANMVAHFSFRATVLSKIQLSTQRTDAGKDALVNPGIDALPVGDRPKP